jgi:hypothetical protein
MQQAMYVKAVQAQREREIAAAMQARGLKRASPSVRRIVGLSIMKVGARLAAEPQPRLARSA